MRTLLRDWFGSAAWDYRHRWLAQVALHLRRHWQEFRQWVRS